MPSPGASSQPPRRQKSRRRRRRKAARSANHNSASRQADLATPAERTANENSARRRATQPRSAANDLPEMKSTPVEHPHSFTSSLLTQPPISAANQNAGISSRRDHSEFWGLYKPAQSDPRQDLTATHSRDNISGFGLSSPALKGVDREKSAVFKELTPSFRTYELHGQGKKKKALTESKTNKYLTLSYKNYLQKP